MEFVISGKVRREQKKQLAKLKLFVKMFWFYEHIDRVYGGGMDDDACHNLLARKQNEIEMLELQLTQTV